jgi:hypothetical protein
VKIRRLELTSKGFMRNLELRLLTGVEEERLLLFGQIITKSHSEGHLQYNIKGRNVWDNQKQDETARLAEETKELRRYRGNNCGKGKRTATRDNAYFFAACVGC